jgi:hypothetical protein
MANYTSEQLYGPGCPCEELDGKFTFNITNPYPSQVAYFTIETVRNSKGFYDDSTPTNGLGTFSNFNNVSALITSSYIASVMVEGASASFDFEPDEAIALSGSFFRGTGWIYIGVEPSGSEATYNLLTEDGNPLITQDNNNIVWPI